MTDEISRRPADARSLIGTAGWVLALAGTVVALAAAYWPRSDILENGTVRLDVGAEQGFALFTLIGVLLATVGGLVGIIASAASPARRALAIVLWALGTAALIVASRSATRRCRPSP